MNILDKIKSFEDAESQFGFNAGASESKIAELKSTFLLSELPSSLEELLKASNGVGLEKLRNELIESRKKRNPENDSCWYHASGNLHNHYLDSNIITKRKPDYTDI